MSQRGIRAGPGTFTANFSLCELAFELFPFTIKRKKIKIKTKGGIDG
ncbi:hypothetical protein HOLDEFILI_00252 [Holdemania filiformis DSM 12042]|uniref:Uncharacterized protein n=1 Tax=Holdemania filiformis DSM 12042 TaxID=545696 RepID=B9Y377_9FIRM|nr:hypothetical protein HOLDEFILI_00252 [Holdemania filiformis DSM 12042]